MSVRSRVTVAATASVAVVLAVTGAVLVSHLRRTLTEGVDDGLEARAIALGNTAIAGAPLSDLAVPGDDDQWVLVVDDGGRVAAAEASVPAGFLVAPPRFDVALPAPDLDGDPTVVAGAVTEPQSGETFRLASRRIDIDGVPLRLHVGGRIDDIDEATSTLRDAMLLAVPVVSALLGALVWFLTGRTLAPVEAIRSTVDSMDGSSPGGRVPEPRGDDEIARLARTMNAMLVRTDHAAERQRRFVADAAHELRSPIARMRTHLEVDDPQPDRLLRDLDGLRRLLDDLLQSARVDSGRSLRTEPVDLDDVVMRAVGDARAVNACRIDASGVSGAQVVGDADALRRVVDNLLDNACRHAAASVSVTLREVGDRAELGVSDDGPGIAPADRKRVFERFARLDDARTHGQGTGLGLAICRDIVVAHGGAIDIDGGHGSGTRMLVLLPLGG